MTMPFDLITVPCLSDNYAFLVKDQVSGTTALFDVPQAAPILTELEARGWQLDLVFLTHHHPDHVQGLAELLTQHQAKVIGASADAHRLPAIDISVSEGDSVQIGEETGTVIDVPGHTIGHVAFHFPGADMAFTGDSLMALGCGRVFEGTHEQMYESLCKLAALPPETIICSGHEYTAANGRFARTVDPNNPALTKRMAEIEAARAENRPTVPSLLSDELATNPYLRAHDPSLATNLGLHNASPAETFSEIRTRKDNF
jgi:hydroxyacylglutathione hydrolase